MLLDPDQWLVSDQVLFEFYRALRNGKILSRPLSHREAFHQIQFLREESGVHHCAYETNFWKDLTRDFAHSNRKSSHLFDRVLAITLRQHGVETFYTRNKNDFESFGFRFFFKPIDVS